MGPRQATAFLSGDEYQDVGAPRHGSAGELLYFHYKTAPVDLKTTIFTLV